jgi:hypothetical protein
VAWAGETNSTTLDTPNWLSLAVVGEHELRVLSPSLLELGIVKTQAPDLEGRNALDWATYQRQGAGPAEFEVTTGEGAVVPVEAVGFKRRVLYAPLQKRDLRIQNSLYLRLGVPLQEGQRVEVKNPSGKLWNADIGFVAQMDAARWSPAIHVNQVGYGPRLPKKAMVGYYLGSLAEMEVATAHGFALVKADSQEEVYQGSLVLRTEKGFNFPTYQRVWEADFSPWQTPGTYRLRVPGLGSSLPFRIDEGVLGVFTRTYALGLYHQRCGQANEEPFTRFTHGADHIAPALIPTNASGPFAFTWNTAASYARRLSRSAVTKSESRGRDFRNVLNVLRRTVTPPPSPPPGCNTHIAADYALISPALSGPDFWQSYSALAQKVIYHLVTALRSRIQYNGRSCRDFFLSSDGRRGQ